MTSASMRGPDVHSLTLALPAGRRLGIAEQGAVDGLPLLLLHYFAGSRLRCPNAEQAAYLSIRLIWSSANGSPWWSLASMDSQGTCSRKHRSMMNVGLARQS